MTLVAVLTATMQTIGLFAFTNLHLKGPYCTVHFNLRKVDFLSPAEDVLDPPSTSCDRGAALQRIAPRHRVTSLLQYSHIISATTYWIVC